MCPHFIVNIEPRLQESTRIQSGALQLSIYLAALIIMHQEVIVIYVRTIYIGVYISATTLWSWIIEHCKLDYCLLVLIMYAKYIAEHNQL